MFETVFSFAGGNVAAMNNLIGSSVALGKNQTTAALIQGVGVGSSLIEAGADLVHNIQGTAGKIASYADDVMIYADDAKFLARNIANKAGVVGAGVSILSVAMKIKDGERLNLGDIISLAGVIASLNWSSSNCSRISYCGTRLDILGFV